MKAMRITWGVVTSICLLAAASGALWHLGTMAISLVMYVACDEDNQSK